MRTLERYEDTARRLHGDGGPEGLGIDDVLEATRMEARNLATGSRSVIRRTLSGDSEAFLRSVPQQVGE